MATVKTQATQNRQTAGIRRDSDRSGGTSGVRRTEEDRPKDRFTKSEEDATDARQRDDDRTLRQMALRGGAGATPDRPGTGDPAGASRENPPKPDNQASVGSQIDSAVGNAVVGQALGDEVRDLLGDTVGGAVTGAVSEEVGSALVGAGISLLSGEAGSQGAAGFAADTLATAGQGVLNGVQDGLVQGAAVAVTAPGGALVGGLAGQAVGGLLGDQAGAAFGGAVGAQVTGELAQALVDPANLAGVSQALDGFGSAFSTGLSQGVVGGVGAVAAAQVGPQVAEALDGLVGQEAAGLAGAGAAGFAGGAVGSGLGAAAGVGAFAGSGVLAAASAGGFVGVGAALAPTVVANSLSGAQALFSDDRDLTFTEQASLALPTFGLSFLANPIKNLFGGGKDPDQQKRDQIRGFLQEAGFADGDYRVRLADGSLFNIGAETVRDGSGQALGRIYTLPWDKEVTPRAVLLAQAVSAAVVGEKDFYTESFTMMLTNAALSNAGDDFATARDNLRQMTADLGLTPEAMVDRILDLRDQGAIDDVKAEVYLQGVQGLFVDDPERDSKPLPPAAFPDFARPTLRGYTVDQLLEAGWDVPTLEGMYAEGRLELAA